LKITLVIAQTNFFVYTNFGPKFPPLSDTHACRQLRLSFTALSIAFSGKADQTAKEHM